MTSLFDDNQQGDPLQIDESKDYFAELVGDNKKYKTPQDLAKSKVHADLTISHRNREFDNLRDDYMKLREEYNAGLKLQEIVDRLSQQSQQSTSSENTQNANENIQKPIDPAALESLVSSKIQEMETTKKQAQNYMTVEKKLMERYGENYKNVLKQQAVELDLSGEEVDALAKRSPAAFFRTFGLDQETSHDGFQAPPQSERRSVNFAPAKTKRTWADYQDLRKKDPKLYYDRKTQNQMHEDAISLGEAFRDGDWNTI